MKTLRLFIILCLLVATLILAGCSNPPETELTPTGTAVGSQQLASPTPTPTQFIISDLETQTQEPIIPLEGILEIRFPDPWGSDEFCASDIPYLLTPSGDSYTLSGDGRFDCHQFTTYEPGFKQHLEQNYDIHLTGEMTIEPDSILQVNLQMTGKQDGYFSDLPPKVPETFTISEPFHIEVDETIQLKFSYVDGAYCLYTENGVLTSLPGEEPPVGEDGWLFILHPGQ